MKSVNAPHKVFDSFLRGEEAYYRSYGKDKYVSVVKMATGFIYLYHYETPLAFRMLGDATLFYPPLNKAQAKYTRSDKRTINRVTRMNRELNTGLWKSRVRAKINELLQ